MSILVRAAAAPELFFGIPAAKLQEGHCARAGHKHALIRPQPGVGERSTAACSYFLHCVRARQKICFGSSWEWGKEAKQPVFLFFTARAQDRNMRFCSSPFWGGSSREWEKETQPLVLIFFTARVQDLDFIARVQ